MAATALAEQTVLGPYVLETATQFTTLTTTAGDPTNMNSIAMSTGRCLVLFYNSDTANAEWVTVYSSEDPHGRTANITQESIVASSTTLLGWKAFIFEGRGWEQTLGGRDLLIDVESADVKLLAIPL